MFKELRPGTLNRKFIAIPLSAFFLFSAHDTQSTISPNYDQQQQEDINTDLNRVCTNIYFDNPDRCQQAEDKTHDIGSDPISNAQSLGTICTNIYFDNPDRCQQ